MHPSLRRLASPTRHLAAFVFAAGLAVAGHDARAQAPEDDAAQRLALPDEAIDAFAFDEPYGLKAIGERNRFLAELDPARWAEGRALRRKLHFARPEERAAATSAILDFYNRVGNWMAREIRHAPLDALDALLAHARENFPTAAAISLEICGGDVFGDEVGGQILNMARPDIIAASDNLSYRAVKAARERPTTYEPLDEAMAAEFFKTLEAEGISPDRIITLFSPEARAALSPKERCDLSRRYMDAAAKLPDRIRGVTLALLYGDDDGSDQ